MTHFLLKKEYDRIMNLTQQDSECIYVYRQKSNNVNKHKLTGGEIKQASEKKFLFSQTLIESCSIWGVLIVFKSTVKAESKQREVF